MSRIVAVTPRLADAVLSAGGTLARHAASGHEVVVAAVFSVAGGEADEAAAATLGLAGVVHLALEDAAARGYEGDEAPYDGLRADDTAPKAAAAGLAIALARLEPDLVLAPLGLSGHVDPLVVDVALEDLGMPRLRWLDLPFALHRTPGAPLAGEVVLVPVGEHLEAKLAAAASYGADLEALAQHATQEGERAGAGGPVEVLVRR